MHWSLFLQLCIFAARFSSRDSLLPTTIATTVGFSGHCSINHCQHGGNCSADSNGSVHCSCPKDFTGYFCENAIPTATQAPPQWTNWTKCFGRCNAKIQMRSLDHNKLETRQCSTAQNCTAYKIRIVHVGDF
ncbi:hypothetical protein ACROYT_G028936 [Oculina patagonica]